MAAVTSCEKALLLSITKHVLNPNKVKKTLQIRTVSLKVAKVIFLHDYCMMVRF